MGKPQTSETTTIIEVGASEMSYLQSTQEELGQGVMSLKAVKRVMYDTLDRYSHVLMVASLPETNRQA